MKEQFGKMFVVLAVLIVVSCSNKQNEEGDPSQAYLEANTSAVEVSPKNEVFTVAFYNVENLFDTEDDPAIDDSEFLPSAKKAWTAERYAAKLNKLASVIDSLGMDAIDKNGPEVVGLCEIENLRVLTDLINHPKLLDDDYGIAHFDSPDGRGIDVALLYKKKHFKKVTAKPLRVSLPNDANFKTRDILLVNGSINGKDEVHFLVNHWPSRRGGVNESAEKREAAAKVARNAVDSLLALHISAKIILLGDFNDEPVDESIVKTMRANETPIFAEKELFNPMVAIKKRGEGTLKYQNDWNLIDQFMLSQSVVTGEKGFVYAPNSANIYKPYHLQQHNDPKYEGSPDRTYAGDRYLGGYSDHFAVYMKLVRK